MSMMPYRPGMGRSVAVPQRREWMQPQGGMAMPGGMPGGQAGWGERAPGVPYTWQDLSFPADPQWLGGYLRDYANKLGYFGDPRQSAAFDFARQQAAATSRGIQRRAQGAAQLSGLPQGQRGFAWLQGMLGGQGAEVGATNAMLRRQFEQQQAWARQLAQMMSGTPDTRQSGPDRGQVIGQIAGTGIGALVGGPPGAAAGGALGGAAGGRRPGTPDFNPYMGQQGFQYPYMGGY